MDNKQNNVIKSEKREFELANKPQAYVISVHIRNMMATYGEEYVRSVMKELFLTEQPKRRTKKTVVNG